MSRNYIKNLETGKIELHFSKEEYQSLPEESKKQLKSNFLFSRFSSAWVSRAKEPNLYHAIQTAKQLGFTEEQRTGERLSFAEQQERKADRAEARAERFDTYATNAAKRAKSLQAEFNKYRGDIAFLTQPNINSSKGRAFTNQRNKIIARYEKGFEEYRKSEYFRERAATARATAEQSKLSDSAYLDNRIRECEKTIKKLTENIVKYEQLLYNIENGIENDHFYKNHSQEQIEKWLSETLERIEAEIDKQAYFQNALDAIGGIGFSRENIKPGYIVKIRGSQYQIVKANPKTVDARCLTTGMILNYNYSEIQKIIKAEEVKPKEETKPHPYQVGEILVACRPADGSIYKAYQVTVRTEKTIQIQQIQVENGKPMPGAFVPGSKPERKKPTVRKWTGQWAVYDNNDWQLYKYSAQNQDVAVSG